MTIGRVFAICCWLGLAPSCSSCPTPNCPSSLDLLAACTRDGSCTVGVSVASCAQREDGCVLSGLNAGTTLVIPLAPRRTMLGTRDDLTFGYAYGVNDPPVAFSSVELLFDDQPAGCMCGRFACTCANVPATTTTISLKPKVGPLPPFTATFTDEDCFVRFRMTAKPCPV